MKGLFSLFALIILTNNLSIAQDYVDTITQEACTCIDNLDYTKSKDDVYLQLGLCIIGKAEPYKVELKRDYKINYSDINGKDGKRLGELIGGKMVGVCPETLVRITQLSDKREKNSQAQATIVAPKIQSISGTIKNISNDTFSSVRISDSEGRLTTLLWLQPFENDGDMMKETKAINGMEVKFEYIEEEFFDPLIQEYRRYKIIRKLVK